MGPFVQSKKRIGTFAPIYLWNLVVSNLRFALLDRNTFREFFQKPIAPLLQTETESVSMF